MRRIVVMGVAGSGKSQLSQRLAERLGCPVLEGDHYHLPASQEKMRAGIALQDADREPWLARLGSELAAHEEGAVLSCSALKRKYRELLRAHVADLRFVYLEIDVHTAANRVASRSGHLFPRSLVTSQFATLESPAGEPGVLEVSALWTTDTQVEAVCRWLEPAASPEPATTTRNLN